jgi:hypothetical protein
MAASFVALFVMISLGASANQISIVPHVSSHGDLLARKNSRPPNKTAQVSGLGRAELVSTYSNEERNDVNNSLLQDIFH